MALFYGTFGCGHPVHPNKVQIINCDNYEIARKIMFAMHGSNFCTVYSEDEWNKSKERGYAKETPLEHIASIQDIEFTEYYTDYSNIESETENKPECYGKKFDFCDMWCVVCPYDLDCQNQSLNLMED